MNEVEVRLEALRLAVQLITYTEPPYSTITVIQDAEAFEDYLLGPKTPEETPSPADPGPKFNSFMADTARGLGSDFL